MKAIDSVYQSCESRAESSFLHLLQKVYNDSEIDGQVKAVRYRMDFVTTDGIAWEVDGRQYHDPVKDAQRDKDLLASKAVQSIVRIPAAVVQFFPFSCIAVIADFAGRYARTIAITREDCVDEWQSALESGEEDTVEQVAEYLKNADAYSTDGPIATIGSGLSFVSGWQRYVDQQEHGVTKNQFTVWKRS